MPHPPPGGHADGEKDSEKDQTSQPVAHAHVEEARAGKGGAEKMQVQDGKDQPPARQVNPGAATRTQAIRKQSHEERRKQNAGLRAEKFEMNQGRSPDRRGEKKGCLGFRKG